jgi:peptidoglycan/LPS O-acetylase OafA/YrhL
LQGESLLRRIGGRVRKPLPTHEEYLHERYFRPLDGVRAISILLVLTWHVNSSLWAWLSGWEGPSIFFVISGFLITTLCLREEDRDGSVSLKAFYIRRACRILPLYYVVFAFYILIDIGFDRQGQRGPLLHVLPYYFTYMNDFAPNVADFGTPFRLSWTLGVEEKFYLLWPLLGFVLLARRPRWRLVAAALLVAVTLVGYDPGTHYLYYSQIMVGCLLAILLHRRESYEWLQKILRFGWLTLGSLLLAHVLMWDHAGVAQIMFGPATALALGSLVVARPSWARPLATRAMIYVGKRSYAVYLVNLICLSACVEVAHHVTPSVVFNSDNQPARHGAWAASLVLLAAVIATSLLLSELLHRTIEGPMIARGRVWSKRITGRRPVAPPRLSEEAEGEEVREPAHEVVVAKPAPSLKQPAPG